MEPAKSAPVSIANQASEAREALLAQHDRLRRVFDDARRLAARVLDTGSPAEELRDRLHLIRGLLGEHNEHEAQLLRPILAQDFAWGQARIDRMVEEHLAEHAEILAALTGPDREVAARVDDVVELLEAHMEAEERTFLSRGVLRDDIVSIEGGA